MQLTLPESIFHRAERLASDRGFASVGDYVSELVLQDDSNPFADRMEETEAALIAGLESGPATPFTRSEWDELARRVLDRVKKCEAS